MKSTVKWHVLIGGFIAYIFDAVEISILAVSLPAIIADLGISPAQAGLLATASWLGIGVSGIAVGWLADNFGRRRAILVSLTVFGVCTLLFGLVPPVFGLLLGLRFVAGLGLGGIWAILSAYVAESWPPKRRGMVTLYVLSAYPAGAALAALVASFLLPGWQLIFVVCGIATIIPIAYFFFLVPESPEWAAARARAGDGAQAPARASVLEIFRGGLLRQTVFGTLAAIFALLGFIGFFTWVPSFLVTDRGLEAAEASRYVIAINVGVFLSYYFFGWVAEKIGKKSTLVLTLALVAVALPVYALIPDVNVLFWYGSLAGFFIVYSGLMGSFYSEIYPVRVRTTGAGFCFNVGRLLASFSPVILAVFVPVLGYHGLIMFCGVFFALSAVAMSFMPGRRALAARVSTPADPVTAGTGV